MNTLVKSASAGFKLYELLLQTQLEGIIAPKKWTICHQFTVIKLLMIMNFTVTNWQNILPPVVLQVTTKRISFKRCVLIAKYSVNECFIVISCLLLFPQKVYLHKLIMKCWINLILTSNKRIARKFISSRNLATIQRYIIQFCMHVIEQVPCDAAYTEVDALRIKDT